MIRTVKIPTSVSRMGCAPGGDCCSDCHQTGPPIGAPAVHVHALSGTRNAVLHSRLGDTACDRDGNCYDTSTGELLSAPLTTGPGCPPGVPSCSASGGAGAGILGMSNTTAFIVGGLGIIALLELFQRR